MSFTPNFSCSQNVIATNFTLTDTSTGSDGAITDRRVFLLTYDNTYLVPAGTTTDYIDFPLSDGASITLDVLSVDYALAITVQWLNVSGSVLYTKTQYFCFTANSMQFFFGLTTQETSEPTIINDTNYLNNKFLLLLYIDSAGQAITQGNDVYKSQFCLNKAQYMINNQLYFF